MAKAPNHGAPWTDTDDATVLTFYPSEAAQLLGRSLRSIYSRRSSKDIGKQAKNRGPRKRLRREYFSRTGKGEREEVVRPVQPEPAKCRFCSQPVFSRGLCRSCVDRAYWLIKMGYVPLEIAERRWFAASKKG